MSSLRSVFDPFRVGAVALDLMEASHALPAAVTLRQRTRLSHVLQAARRDSRFYRERWPEHSGTAPALHTLPVVTRRELMAHFDDWVTDPRLNLTALRAFTADPGAIGKPYLDDYIIWESSGTSGQPGIFVQDAHSMAVYDALESVRRSAPRPLLGWTDPLGLDERIAFVGATDGHFASYVTVQRLRQINPWMSLAVRSFSILQPTQALVDGLNDFAPTVIAAYPTAAALLADETERGALRLPLREIWTGGETLSAAVRQRVGRVLGGAVRNSYGSSEFLSMGWECAQGQMHLNADWVLLEPVDERHQPMPPGELSFTTLLTHLANTVQPLIRYDMGDQIRIAPERCECGSPLPVIEVRGRCDDALVMAGARGRPVTLLPLALTTVLEDQAGVFDFQLRQQDDHTLVLRLAQRGEAGAACMARCSRALKAFAAAQGLQPIRVLEELGQVPAHGRSGKTCRVVARKTQQRAA